MATQAMAKCIKTDIKCSLLNECEACCKLKSHSLVQTATSKKAYAMNEWNANGWLLDRKYRCK